MKKYILAGALMFSGVVGVFAISNRNAAESSEAKDQFLPCRMHVDLCPSGHFGGYHCSKGLPSLPECRPDECDQIFPCNPGFVQ